MTIIFETIAIILMKQADGTQHKAYFIGGAICYTLTFFLLSMALKYLPMGYTNAIWAGTSTFLVYMIGIWYFEEKTSWLEAFFLGCILVGIIGLNYMGRGK